MAGITVIKKADISKGLSVVGKAVSANPAIPLLSNVLLECANGNSRVAATNLEIAISYTFPSNGTGFRTCVPASTFSGLMDAMQSEEIEIQMEKSSQSAVVMSETSTSKVKCASAEEFPDIPVVETPSFSLPVQQFKEMVQRVAFCSTTRQGVNPVLAGVLLQVKGSMFIMFAVDGYHMSYEEFDLGEEVGHLQAVVRGATLETIARILPDNNILEIQVTTNKALFHCGNIDVVTQVLDGEYPRYDQLKAAIGEPQTTVQVATLDLLRACRQLKVFAGEQGYSKMDIKGMFIEYSAGKQEHGDSSISVFAAKQGGDMALAINVNLLYEFLEVCKLPEVIIELVNRKSMIVFHLDKMPNFYHVIMPLELRS